MKKSPDPFKGKHILILGAGAESVAAATWLLDQGASATITDRAAIRSIQGHLRATATDGDEYERRKSRLSWVTEDEAKALLPQIDLVVTRTSGPLIQSARERGIQIVTRTELSGAFPLPPRQEVAHESAKLTIVNDIGAISPERGILSLRQWGGPNCIVIAGGDGRGNYDQWADVLTDQVRPTNTIFLTGSATGKMRKALGKRARGIRTYDSPEQAWRVARARAAKFISAVILFSPGAKSSQNVIPLIHHERNTTRPHARAAGRAR